MVYYNEMNMMKELRNISNIFLKTGINTSRSTKVSAMCKSKTTKEQAYKMIENYTK